MRRRRDFASDSGFTLLELMIAVAVAAILATIAFQSYRSYVLRSHRAVVRAVMVDIAARLEAEALKLRAYPTTIGFYTGDDEIEINIDNSGRVVPEATGTRGVYKLRMLQQDGGRAREIVATAINGQLDDTPCQRLTLSTRGLRTSSPGPTKECWGR